MATPTQWADLPLKVDAAYNEDEDTLVRQSIIGQMQLCPQRVALQGKPGYLKAVSEPLVFGTLVHELIACDLQEGERQAERLMKWDDWVEPILQEQYEWTIDLIPKRREFYTEVGTAYRAWVSHVLPEIETSKIMALEEEMQLYLGEGRSGGVWFQGTADLVLEDVIVDWKTSRKGWKDSKAQFGIQPTLYPPLIKQTYNKSVRSFAYWVFDRQKRQWTPHYTKRRIRTINAGLHIAYDYGLQIEAEIFPATPLDENYFEYKRGWWCSPKYCEAWNICEYNSLPDDVSPNDKAKREW